LEQSVESIVLRYFQRLDVPFLYGGFRGIDR
jgi:hypothetical protein